VFLTGKFVDKNAPKLDTINNSIAHYRQTRRRGNVELVGKMFCVPSNVSAIKDLGDIVYKMFALLASLVALKFTPIGETLFAKHYMLLVLTAVMVFFLLWIFYTLVLLDHHTTITTLFPISLLYGIVCAVSFAAFRIISPDTNFAIFNLALWLFVYIIIVIIYNRNQSFDDVAATYGSELPLVAAIHGDGDISEHKLDVSGDECLEVSISFDRDYDGMVDLEENRVVMMMETDAR
jgi:hypothetical protein